ncbi:MAG: glutamate racemase [Mucilaginibacter polytrichastri]|nr:glutamate racemase [Mucilaginibacter polytrichastri]
MQAKKPIGIFDSGIGGLTVASAIRSVLPNEPVIYFGDTAHMPYGDKSPEAIKYYSLKITKFLIDQGCKAIVIACNTASSLAFHDLQDFLGGHLPIYNVIDPVVQRMVADDRLKRIGVIATKATIDSDIYARKIKDVDPGREVAQLATPLLAPMIEEGFFNNTISQTVIEEYLSSPVLRDIDGLILACTHYPLIRKEIDAFFGGQISIADNGIATAEFLREELGRLDLLNSEAGFTDHFFVSDYTQSFESSTRIFFGDRIRLEKKDIWM